MRERQWYKWLELVAIADSLGYELTIDNLRVGRIMRLTSKTDPECWGTVADLSTGEPAKGVRHYSRGGWDWALPDNIRVIEEARKREIERA